MSTETTNKKIKIDNGTTFGRTYTDKAVDAKLPTDLIASANKLSLGVGNAALGNGVNLDGFTYDEATKTLNVSGGELTGDALMNVTKNSKSITRTLDTDGKVKLDVVGGGGGVKHKWVTIKYIYPYIAAKEYSIGEEIKMGDEAYVDLDGSELSVMIQYPAIFEVDGVVFAWTITLNKDYSTRRVKAYLYCIKPGTVTHATNYTLEIAANK